MSDPKEIKKQTRIRSENVTPEDAAASIENFKAEEMKDVAGGMLKGMSKTYEEYKTYRSACNCHGSRATHPHCGRRR